MMIYLLINHKNLTVDMYAKSRENPEHQYWPDQSWQIRGKKKVLPTLPCIGRVGLSVSQKQFSSDLCKLINNDLCFQKYDN